MRGRLGLWGDAVQLKCLLQASVRPGEDKIKSIRLSPSSSCFSDSKATGTSDVRRSVRVCVCVHTSLCVFVQVYSIWGERAEADVAPASNTKTEVDFELIEEEIIVSHTELNVPEILQLSNTDF